MKIISKILVIKIIILSLISYDLKTIIDTVEINEKDTVDVTKTEKGKIYFVSYNIFLLTNRRSFQFKWNCC